MSRHLTEVSRRMIPPGLSGTRTSATMGSRRFPNSNPGVLISVLGSPHSSRRRTCPARTMASDAGTSGALPGAPTQTAAWHFLIVIERSK